MSPTTETVGRVAVTDKLPFFLTIAGLALLVDIATKEWIVANYTMYQSAPVLGDLFRITYTHNPGAAFGISVGEHSRLVFLALSLLALGVLAYLYVITPAADRLRLGAVALVTGGALGNILDRLRYERGVVDFLDFGIGAHRWYVFNMADVAVSIGAILLLISFYMEEQDEHRRRKRRDERAGA